MAKSLYDKHGTSDEFNDPYCDICCEAKNINVRPEGYCHECYQCLCKDCLVVHTRLPSTKYHVIRTGEDMPKSQDDKPPMFEHCAVHQPHRKDQYCSTHRVLLCTLCVPVNHKDCHVESVECAAKNIPSSEIDLLNNTCSALKTQLLLAESSIQSNVSDLRDQKNKIIKELQKIYDKTMSKINKLFQDIKSDLESKYKCQTLGLECDQKNIKDATLSLKSILDDINVLKGRIIDSKAFLKIQDILKNIDKCKTDVSRLNQTTTRRMLNFVPDKTLNNVLSTSFTLGTISLEESNRDVTISIPGIMFPSFSTKLSQATAAGYRPSGNTKPISEIKAQKHTEYNIELRDDKDDCYITGLSITPDGRRLLADWRNSKIKMFSRDMKIISSLSLPDAPWDIAVSGDREAVVSVGSKLFIVDVSDKQISIRRTVELFFEVHGIVTHKDKLVVTSRDPSPTSVKLVDPNGIVYWSKSTDQQGQQLFSWPEYVTCYDGERSSTVIVTDLGKNTLTLLNSDTGDVIRRYQVEGKGPRGVTNDTVGNVYVCYSWTDEVAVLSRDFSEEKFHLTQRDGISGRPLALVYDSEDHRLLVSYGRNVVDCFQLL